MRRLTTWAVCGSALLAVACGGKRTEAEHLLLRWAQALNTHLATDAAGGNSYPRELAEMDSLMRLGLSFDDPWGQPIHYRRVNDGKYDIASAGEDGELGSADDVIVSNGMLYAPDKLYASRPASRRFPAQSESGAAPVED